MRSSGGIDLDCSTLPRNSGTDSAATSDPFPVTLAPNLNAGFNGSEPAISRFWASYAAIRNGCELAACSRIAPSALLFAVPGVARSALDV